MQNVAVEKRYVNGGVRLSFFVQESDINPGEYVLVPAEEANAKDARIAKLEKERDDLQQCAIEQRERLISQGGSLLAAEVDSEPLKARIAELESQLAERSPGVMPEAVKALCGYYDGKKWVDQQFHELANAVRAYYAPPAGHEWHPVDAEHPITADDVGLKVAHRCGGISGPIDGFGKNGLLSARIGEDDWDVDGRYWTDSDSGFDITHILRPVAAPFVFAGDLGWYEFKSTFGAGRMEVVARADGSLAGLHEVGRVDVNADGTFAGGRITGKVSG